MVSMPAQSYALDTTWRTLLKDLGVVPANVLRRAGLTDDLLQQPSVRLAPEDYYRLWDSIEAETGDPLFPHPIVPRGSQRVLFAVPVRGVVQPKPVGGCAAHRTL